MRRTDPGLTVFDLLSSPLPESQKLLLKCLSSQDHLESPVQEPEVNRPGLALCGFFDHFGEHRVQIFGRGETAFLQQLAEKKQTSVLLDFFSRPIACCIFTHSLQPTEQFTFLAKSANVPILQTELPSNEFITRLLGFFSNAFAPRETIHGVLVEVHGIGMLILGDSGVGKSEAALELLDRGHRLVSDDLVELRLINGGRTVVGHLVNNLNQHHYIEIRGIGIINVEHLFGTRSCLQRKNVDLVIRLELDAEGKIYERTSYQNRTYELLGVRVPLLSIPVKPGRNIPVILESAALHFRSNQQAETLYDAVLTRLSVD